MKNTPGPVRTLCILCLSTIFACSSDQPEMSLPDRQAGEDVNNHIVGIGRIEPELRIVDMASEVLGIVEDIRVQPGERVIRGQIILQFLCDVEQAQVEQAKARIEAQKALVLSAQENLSVLEIKSAYAKTNYERVKKLFEQGAVTKAYFDDAKANFESLVKETHRLKADVVSAEAFLRQTLADLKLAQAHLNRKNITAPADGELLSLDITLGSIVTPGEPFGTFAIQSPLSAWCEIDELFSSQVRLNQEAFIRSEGLPDTLAWGVVSFVGPYLRKKSIFSDDVGALEDRRVREVRIRLQPNTSLLFGQRIECVIKVNHKE